LQKPSRPAWEGQLETSKMLPQHWVEGGNRQTKGGRGGSHNKSPWTPKSSRKRAQKKRGQMMKHIIKGGSQTLTRVLLPLEGETEK